MEILTPPFLIFFGNRHSTLERLQEEYPHLSFRFVRQVHGREVVPAIPNEFHTLSEIKESGTDADGHFSLEKNVALGIVTADCVPLMACSAQTGKTMALHAGWKGVVAQIVKNGFSQAFPSQEEKSSLKVYIGPHIHAQHFEVDVDVARYFSPKNQQRVGQKYHLDLFGEVKDQLEKESIFTENITHIPMDTYKLLEFHSYRRDRETAGRQVSFIARIGD